MLDEYFASRTIDIPAVLQDVCHNLPNKMFANNRSEFYKLVVPPITDEILYYGFRFPNDVFIKQIINGKESKTDDSSIIYGTLGYAEKVYTVAEFEDFVFCRHGDLYLVDREEEERIIYIKTTITYRIPESLHEDVVLSFKNLYYALCTRNIDLAYQSMSAFSDTVNNAIEANTRTVPLMATDIDVMEDYEL